MEFTNEAVSGGLAVEKNSFTWTIQNFDILRRSEEYINSQKFKFKAGETLGLVTEWMLSVQTKTKKKEGEDDKKDKKWIGCFLSLSNPPSSTDGQAYNGVVSASWQLSINKSARTPFFSETTYYTFMKDGKLQNGYGWPEFLRQDEKLSNLPLINGSLVMNLKIHIYTQTQMTVPTLVKTLDNIATLENQYKLKFLEKLAQDLGRALDGPPQRSDAQTKIVLNDGKEFEVNRGILCARSPVFERMFQTKMSESENGIVKIKDISSQTMSIVLRFIYTGRLSDDWRDSDVIAEIVYAAGKYELSDLLEFLNETVGSVCSKETVGDLINLARKLSMEKAEKDLFEFIKKNMSTYDDMILFAKLNQFDVDENSSDDSESVDSKPEVVDSESGDDFNYLFKIEDIAS